MFCNHCGASVKEDKLEEVRVKRDSAVVELEIALYHLEKANQAASRAKAIIAEIPFAIPTVGHFEDHLNTVNSMLVNKIHYLNNLEDDILEGEE